MRVVGCWTPAKRMTTPLPIEMLIEMSFLLRPSPWGSSEERTYHILFVFQATIPEREFFSDNGPILRPYCVGARGFRLLPLAEFDLLFDLAFEQVAFERAEKFDEEFAVDVVVFMQHAARRHAVDLESEFLAVEVDCRNGDDLRTFDLEIDSGEAQTAFLADDLAFDLNDLGVDADDAVFGLFARADVHHEEFFRERDLRPGQADALGLVHRFEHVADEFGQPAINIVDLFAFLLQHRVAVFDDW